MYEIGDAVVVNDLMQKAYYYVIEAPVGREFAPSFQPYFTPQNMLEMGVFEGKYCCDCQPELPQAWFDRARLAKRPDPSLTYFRVKSRQSLAVWRNKGWIMEPDPRGIAMVAIHRKYFSPIFRKLRFHAVWTRNGHYAPPKIAAGGRS